MRRERRVWFTGAAMTGGGATVGEKEGAEGVREVEEEREALNLARRPARGC